jgi:hypothetical protein
MRGVRSPRWALVALAVGLVAGAFGAGVVPDVASAASPHRAAVIVDTGSSVKRVVVTFDEDSITGLDALQRAGANPVVYQFGGQGGAVCRLLGVGRDAGPDCLGGGDGDARYWAYFRAPAGTSTFKYSSIGGGSARVHDGDVEGWKFGTGSAPQYVSLASLLPPTSPPPTQPPPTAPPASAGGGTPGAVAPGSPGTPAATAATGAAPTASTLPATGGTDAAARTKTAAAADGSNAKTNGSKATATGTDDDGKAVDTALASSGSGDGGGGSTWSLVLFGVLLAAIAVAIVLVRRVRKHAGAG